MVSHHGCIRVLKQTLALQALGHTVDLLVQTIPFGHNSFNAASVFHDTEQLKRSVATSKADLFHVHNEPDWMVGAVREATARPIIFDVHDLNSLRQDEEPEPEELEAFSAADGFVHVSEPCRLYAEKHHGNSKPTAVLPCYVNERFYPDHFGDVSWSSLVYEGGLSTSTAEGTLNWRDLRIVAKAFIAQKFNVYFWPAMALPDYAYENIGAFVGQPAPYPTMLTALRAFGYGFVGYHLSTPLLEAAMPNKMFEYMSQGVVPVILSAETAADWAEERGVGIRLRSLENLAEQLADGPKVREQILAQHREFTMEKHIEVVADLYEQVLSR